jgi:hypothetical protein
MTKFHFIADESIVFLIGSLVGGLKFAVTLPNRKKDG